MKADHTTPIDLITPELLARHDRPGPRYTSYPTAVEFDERFSGDDYEARLAEANERPDDPLSLYVHIPFCERRCAFCGCNVIISRNRRRAEEYLGYLFRELELLASKLPDRRRLVQYHWGGGTPTYLSPAQMATLADKVNGLFEIDPGAEVALEIDPEVTEVEQLEVAHTHGFNRLSIGVQDFDPRVLEAVERAQSRERTAMLMEEARRIGFESINVDLIYGLPHQEPARYERTLEEVVALRPDRVAVYSFAYVPWIKGNQKRLPADFLPDRDTKFALFASAIRTFVGAGYLQIGMDHFALPGDEMGIAAANGTLYRNFMGYTVHRAPDMLGAGVSSIGHLGDAFAQNAKKSRSYYRALDEGRFPVERGYVLNRDDRIRQRVITELMCNSKVEFSRIEEEFEIGFREYFCAEFDELGSPDGFLEQDFARVEEDRIEVTPLGRLFIRNLCMVFDAHLKKKAGSRVFSRTV